ncbi:membrane-spanning 4-domains subfamily A member 4D-like [Myripristis murdjan]|uniref:Membrane-spanning 4-domains subfamily A member 4D-like n=1 Tax=Myripristis murdjan TaxID=586833 RepID=A0A667WKZ9_9TELE|nr:membrane-spanning 4-domains subfamily A member 4D-like [Myripristis murdjan]
MEDTESTARERTRGNDGNQEPETNTVLMSSKPLHRFISGDPKSLGIVVLIFGCAELLMGFQMAKDKLENSTKIYVPFWQGALFLICGNLSIYTGVHPSKRMVTVCLAMYVVSILGILLSLGIRIWSICYLLHLLWRYWSRTWAQREATQLLMVEVVLFISTFCVSVLLIFLSAKARLALKSTHTQVVVQHVQQAE